jgi:hypothetical protein
MDSEGTYRIVTVCFDKDGNELAPAGIASEYDTSCPFPTFGIVKPAVTNTRMNMSPYGQFVKTATEVSSDNSTLMRNIRRHENAPEGAIADIALAVMCVSRGFGESIPGGGFRARAVRRQHHPGHCR